MTLADRIVVMRDGEVEQVGSPMDIYSNPVSYFVADFFGSPSMNLVPGSVVAEGERRGFRSDFVDLALPTRFNDTSPGAATLGIRPEHVHVVVGNGQSDAALPVRLVEPLGKDTLLYFETGGERAFVAVTEGLGMSSVPVGAQLGLTFPAVDLHLFDSSGRRIGPPAQALAAS
jgi:ABC-type sugar transport system ATPase subunit